MVDESSEDVLGEKAGSETKKLMLIVIIISAVFLGIMGAGFYVLWHKASSHDPQIEQKQEKDAEEEKDDSDIIKPVHSLDTFIVNLADRGGTRYLRATMDMELSDEKTKAEIEKRLPQIRDAILTIIPSKSIKDINTIEGKTALRDEIMKKINTFIKKGRVTNIYFTEFVIQ